VILDSDVLIDFLNGRASTELMAAIESGRLLTTTISLFEVLRGTAGARRSREMTRVFELVEQLPLTALAATRAAQIDQQLRAVGQRLDTADTLIAGIALANDLPVVTRNRRHFDRIPGLVVEEI
jgi:tRNA(fMet)-specific endonuclease VapC